MPLPFPRSSGILLHPTSLPGPYGIGDLGPEAHRFIRQLADARQAWWQILPLGPTGAGNSPYQSYSAFAGNIALLSPDWMVRDGLIPPTLLKNVFFPIERVDFANVLPFKSWLLRQAWDQFRGGRVASITRSEFDHYRKTQASWLDDYAFFMAIREALGGAGLSAWPTEVRRRDPKALAALEGQLSAEIQMHAFGQFLFDRQWKELRQAAAQAKIQIIGDAPIFVSGDSAEVWAHPELFLLDAKGDPTAVAGVPPDYFSPTGQHWGNPLYDWEAMARTGYAWWTARLRRQLEQVDLIRLDHFRGFAAAWHIPAGEKDAIRGKWVPGPGYALFEKLRADLGRLPLIAEDLGLITADVHELRLKSQLPGMRVLQFALGGSDSPHWPHNFDRLTAVYTGTHDNDTSRGWYEKLNDGQRWVFGEYLGRPVLRPSWELIRFAWSSVAVLAVAPLQDVLELGTEARMNIPGVATGNWEWRYRGDQLRPELLQELARLTDLFNRLGRGDSTAH